MAAPRALLRAGLGLRQQTLPIARRLIQRRTVQTQSFASNTSEILVKQRRVRPVSPHLTIYKPQVSWILSGFNRLTGVIVSAGLYMFAWGYLVGPTLGYHFEPSVIAAKFAAWGVATKVALKTFMALPFVFHSVNGLRHLAWDAGAGFKKHTVIKTGWTAVALTAIGTAYLAWF